MEAPSLSTDNSTDNLSDTAGIVPVEYPGSCFGFIPGPPHVKNVISAEMGERCARPPPSPSLLSHDSCVCVCRPGSASSGAWPVCITICVLASRFPLSFALSPPFNLRAICCSGACDHHRTRVPQRLPPAPCRLPGGAFLCVSVPQGLRGLLCAVFHLCFVCGYFCLRD